MASSIPAQTRAVDPFASFNSDTVNQLTKMVTRGDDGLTTQNSLDVIADTTSPLDHVIVNPGTIYKDDVLITVTNQWRVDFTDSDQYISGSPLSQIGYYYVVLEYTYQRSRPAPQARIKILLPTETDTPSLGTSLFFLKAVRVVSNGLTNEISSFHDADPTDTDNKREYTPLFFGVEVFLPTHDPTADIGRVIYEASTDSFWFGYSNRWGKISAGVEIDIDTTGTYVGAICYTDSDGKATLADANSVNTGGEMVVSAIGLEIDRSGRALMSGFVEDVRVQTGIIIQVGQILYLSLTQAGRVTNIRGNPHQVVGRAVTGGNEVIPIDILFFPRDVLGNSISGTILPADWTYDTVEELWLEEIDITNLDTTGAVLTEFYDQADDKEIQPSEVGTRSEGTILQVWMVDGTHTIDYIISTGGGGTGDRGGGGAVTDHDLLLNLSFAASGHTGFAADPHGNAAHSSTFITATEVTYVNMNAIGDVGTGAAQVAQGDHTHAALDAVPSGEIILFEKDTSVSGYTLLTTKDDMIIYITKGSVAGGEVGGTDKAGGSWSQPNHAHNFSGDDGGHNHKWYDAIGGSPDRSWQSDGASITQFNTGGSGEPAIVTDASSDKIHGTDMWTQNTTAAITGTTVGGATSSSWRPQGRNFTRQQRI